MQMYVEVEDNPNSYGIPLRTFSTKGEPYAVSQVKMDIGAAIGVPCWVTGWTSKETGIPCAAYCVPVEDSGSAISYLVYGGDWGLRFRPLDDQQDWSLDDPRQFGEPYLLLADESDVTRA